MKNIVHKSQVAQLFTSCKSGFCLALMLVVVHFDALGITRPTNYQLPTTNYQLSTTNFSIVALVDSLDFAKNFDIETTTGTVQTLEHVLLTHSNDIWWRDKGGGRMRYPSECEMWQVSEAPFDKKRLPSEDVYGYLRLESHRGNEFPVVREECRKRGLGFGIHTTIEENHW